MSESAIAALDALAAAGNGLVLKVAPFGNPNKLLTIVPVSAERAARLFHVFLDDADNRLCALDYGKDWAMGSQGEPDLDANIQVDTGLSEVWIFSDLPDDEKGNTRPNDTTAVITATVFAEVASIVKTLLAI